jgi:membrane peptidoglycan carboxypeptidase
MSIRDIFKDKQKLQKYILYGSIGLIVFMFLTFMIVFAWFSRDLPSPGKLSQGDQNATIFYDRDGKVLFQMYKDKNRLPIAFKDIADTLKKGTIAIEDKDFYKHGAISNTGIIRSFILLLLRQKISGGGSTITQQLIKNVLLDSQQTTTRKLKEIILAFSAEEKYT